MIATIFSFILVLFVTTNSAPEQNFDAERTVLEPENTSADSVPSPGAEGDSSSPAKALSLKTMEKEMIALEKHIELHMAEEKASLKSREEESSKNRGDPQNRIISKQYETAVQVNPKSGVDVASPKPLRAMSRKPASKTVVAGPRTDTSASKALKKTPSSIIKTVEAAKNSPTTKKAKKSSLSGNDEPVAPSLKDMEREVIELEKQIQRHMVAREKALVKVAAATSKCNPADKECGHAHEQINWKLSKDKYEQAAMKDILKEDHQNSTEEGQELFAQYASQADQLSGLQSLANLNNETTTLVHQHILAEHESLHELREAEEKLDRLKIAERKMHEQQRAALDRAAISKAQEHMRSEVERMSGAPGAQAPVKAPLLAAAAKVKAKSPEPDCLYGCDTVYGGQLESAADPQAGQASAGGPSDGTAAPAPTLAASLHAAAAGRAFPAESVPVYSGGAAGTAASAEDSPADLDSAAFGARPAAVTPAAARALAAAGLTSASSPPAPAPASESALAPAPAPAGDLMSEREYRRDVSQAVAVEAARRAAFRRTVQALAAKV